MPDVAQLEAGKFQETSRRYTIAPYSTENFLHIQTESVMLKHLNKYPAARGSKLGLKT